MRSLALLTGTERAGAQKAIAPRASRSRLEVPAGDGRKSFPHDFARRKSAWSRSHERFGEPPITVYSTGRRPIDLRGRFRDVSDPWQISRDVHDPQAIPYFNWDAPVTNETVRRALREGTEDDRLYWIARILREAQYDDVWQYVALRRDVLPRWELLRPRLGRRRAFWEFLLDRWRSDGLLS